jgi:predicted transcriptional regulator
VPDAFALVNGHPVGIRQIDLRQAIIDHLRMAVRIATNLTLPPDLVEEVDRVAGRRNRSAFVEAAIRDRLKREQLRLAIARVAGAWTADEYPEFATSQDVTAWVRERRAEESDPIEDSSRPEPTR